MMVKSKTLEPTSPQLEEEPASNGWERLLPLLDPRVVKAMSDPEAWKKLDGEVVFWLIHTAAKSPWLNHLALAGAIHSGSGTAHPLQPLKQTLSFLRWAIPEHYPDLTSLKVEEALVAYYGDPPQSRGYNAATAYGSLQLYTQRYLESAPSAKRKAWEPFLLPRFVRTGRLVKLRYYVQAKAQEGRKEQAFAVVRELPALAAMGRHRYKWLADLEAQVQQVAEAARTGQVSLPAIIPIRDLDNRGELVFRIWDRASWIKAHPAAYSHSTLYLVKRRTAMVDQAVFLQFVGELPATPWFLRALEAGLFQGTRPSAETRQYIQNWQALFMGQMQAGLLRPNVSMGQTLSEARRSAAGTPDDSRIVFCVEPMLAGAAVGLFVLVSLVQTGMRIGELMQVTLDRECLESGYFPQFDDQTGAWRKGPQQVYWRLYPKGRERRERYLVTPQMLEALLILLDLHKRFYGEGSLKPVSARRNSQFSHARRYAGQHKFVLQWGGHHIPIQTIQKCLSFLLLEHICRDPEGKPTRITTHILRHGVAGWLRHQGVPLEDIMALLKQVNLAVTDYYSQLSPQDLYNKIGPALTALADLAEVDPSAIRTVGDIRQLVHEALKRYGVLRHTPGGTCAVFTPCEVQFKCAGCPHYVPDPARQREVQEKMASHAHAIRVFGDLGDYLQADVQKAHLRAWEKIAKEMEALSAVELVSPPAENVLRDLGLDDLGEALLQNLKQLPQLPPGKNGHHA
jgi:hypothetical protein